METQVEEQTRNKFFLKKFNQINNQTPPAQPTKKKEIIIIWPAEIEKQSSLAPPLGLIYINSSLKSAGYKTKVVDVLFDPEMKELKTSRIIGGIYMISFPTALFNQVKEIISIIRQKDPESFIIGGGPHPSANREKTLEELDIDLIVLGESEIGIVDVVKTIEISGDFSKILGIIYRDVHGQIVKTADRPFIENLDDLPIPDPSEFPMDKYFSLKGYREMSVYTSRGCPYRCTFCQPILISLFGPKVRYQSPKKVVDSIEFLVKKFKLDSFVFTDDTFAFHQDRVVEICKEIIRRKIPIIWRCQTRVNLTRNTLEYMKKAGCIFVAFGVESGSQKILDNVNKMATVQQAIEVFKNCKELGILTHAYLMVGNLGESKQTVQETIDLIKTIKPFSWNVSISTPYPGTYLYEYATKNNLLVNRDWSKYDHILSSTVGIKHEDLTQDDLVKERREVEKACEENVEKMKDLIGVIDKDFIYRMSKLIYHNPGFLFRMGKLTAKSFMKMGFNLSNPKLGK